jgi:hypothetical protein
LEWNLKNNDFQLYDLQNFKNTYISSIEVADNYLFVVINEQKSKGIIHYNYRTHTKQTIQYIEDEVISIESFFVDTIGKTTGFCLFLKNKQGTRAELFVTDYSGKVKKRIVFPIYEDLIYNSAKATVTGRDSLLIMGGYSNVRDKKQSGCFSGIYTLLYSQNNFSEVRTYSFGALLSKDSAYHAKYIGEPNLAMNMHIKQSNGQFFAITEVLYPEYQYTTSTSHYRSFGYYGYDPPSYVFAGFRFLNAYILQFGTRGQLVDEWYVPFQNLLTQSVYNMIDIYQDKEGNSLFFYGNQNNIVSQFMHGRQVLAAQATMPVELLSRTDILEYSSNLSMRNWYGNRFFFFFFQYIKNLQRSIKRYVFFMNKMICE